MSYGFLDIAVTPGVRAMQAETGADRIWRDFKGHREFHRFSENEAAFVADRDGFYMATVSGTGWPYIQHRGCPCGVVKLLDDRKLAFADYRGNVLGQGGSDMITLAFYVQPSIPCSKDI